ncbi:hypothetical protein [Belnapia moabensis]|uniref:hypothetical protein n=1 Tax=Belnapia moabensis TaxID=365533 RepID=UPI0012EE46AC|nr:hypothetical protein [Belnapia moabensis]
MEGLIICAAVAAGGGIVLARPQAPQASGTVPAAEALRRRFDGMTERLHETSFETDRLMIGYDGAVGVFIEAETGRVCIIQPGEDGSLVAHYRNLRHLTAAEVTELVEVAPAPGVIGRLTGAPRKGARIQMGADLKLAFESDGQHGAISIVVKFGPGEAASARMTSSGLRSESTCLKVADAKAAERAKARDEATERRRVAEAEAERVRQEKAQQAAEQRALEAQRFARRSARDRRVA